MKQFVKMTDGDEDAINELISQQAAKGYKALSITCSRNNWGLLKAFILFEEVETKN